MGSVEAIYLSADTMHNIERFIIIGAQVIVKEDACVVC